MLPFTNVVDESDGSYSEMALIRKRNQVYGMNVVRSIQDDKTNKLWLEVTSFVLQSAFHLCPKSEGKGAIALIE